MENLPKDWGSSSTEFKANIVYLEEQPPKVVKRVEATQDEVHADPPTPGFEKP